MIICDRGLMSTLYDIPETRCSLNGLPNIQHRHATSPEMDLGHGSSPLIIRLLPRISQPARGSIENTTSTTEYWYVVQSDYLLAKLREDRRTKSQTCFFLSLQITHSVSNSFSQPPNLGNTPSKLTPCASSNSHLHLLCFC